MCGPRTGSLGKGGNGRNARVEWLATERGNEGRETEGEKTRGEEARGEGRYLFPGLPSPAGGPAGAGGSSLDAFLRPLPLRPTT